MPIATDIDESTAIKDSILSATKPGTTCKPVRLLENKTGLSNGEPSRSQYFGNTPVPRQPDGDDVKNADVAGTEDESDIKGNCHSRHRKLCSGIPKLHPGTPKLHPGTSKMKLRCARKHVSRVENMKERRHTSKISVNHGSVKHTDVMEDRTCKRLIKQGKIIHGKLTPTTYGNAARERSRVQTLRAAFLSLQRHLPSVPVDTKLAKLDVLLLAIAYIGNLRKMLQQGLEAEGTDTSRQTHPLKKWPMRCRLYESIGSASSGNTG